jgi:hypothetical protein
MEQSPSSETNSLSVIQSIRLLWNQTFHYCVHYSSPMVPILSQKNPANTFPPYLPKIHSNIILPSTPKSSERSLSFRFSD